MAEKRTGKWIKKEQAWVATLADLEDEDNVYVHSNGLVLKAGAAKRASWREFNIPDDKVVVVTWADGEDAGAAEKLAEDRVQTGVGGYVDIVAIVVVIILLLIVLKVFHII